MDQFKSMPSIFKARWERYREHVPIGQKEISRLISNVCLAPIVSTSLLKESCANTNYLVSFEKDPPIVVRIYSRDPSVMDKEIELHQLLIDKVPVPRVLYADNSHSILPFPIAIFSYVEGILLRDLIFSGDRDGALASYFDAGRHLATLKSITFLRGGFFEQHLQVRPFDKEDAYLNWANSLLKTSTLKRELGTKLINRIQHIFAAERDYLPSNETANLTHGDFDPSNIKVANVDGVWRISGIMDWEFAFAGSYFVDIGMMLRYSHKLPGEYERSFLDGLSAQGISLPSSWKHTAKLTDLLSLLKIACANPRHRRPILHHDVFNLILDTVDYFNSS